MKPKDGLRNIAKATKNGEALAVREAKSDTSNWGTVNLGTALIILLKQVDTIYTSPKLQTLN